MVNKMSRNIGIPGVVPPKSKAEDCKDQLCPFHGTTRIRGKITKGIVLAILAALIVVLFIKLDTLTKEPAFIGADTAANGNVNLSILPYTCYMNITMYSGWNLISIKCEQSNEALTTVLAPISGNYTAVEAFWANDTGDPWKKYDPAVPPFINDLNSVDHVHGYWVNMSLPDTLEINGTISYRTNILQ